MNDDAPATILVVDDNEMNRDMLSRRLARRGYTVLTAEDGQTALDTCAEQPFDLILLDIMMPGIDGFEVLEQLRKEHSATALPVIMATAKDQSDDIVRALKLGANDYVTKPLDFPVVLARVQGQLSLKRAVEEVVRLNHVISAANERMSRDLDAAARIQSALLPTRLPEVAGARFGWSFRPCDELAGDILNIFSLDEGHAGLYVLDVSGHGVASALLSVTVSRFLSPMLDASSLLKQPTDAEPGYRLVAPAEVADQLNRRFEFDPDTGQFFTMVYGILDLASRQFHYVSAGHPGLVYLSAGAEPQLLESPGFPVGLADCPYEAQTLTLRPGDRFYLYSDGIVEAMDAEHRPFGSAKLLATLEGVRNLSLQQGIDALVAEVEAHSGGKGHMHDDVSVVGVEIAD